MLKEGIKGTQEVVVSEENTAKTMGSGALDVFATPAMIALMEKTARGYRIGPEIHKVLQKPCGSS